MSASSPKRWPGILATAVVVLLIGSALGAGAISSHLARFSYLEVDTSAALLPAGALSVSGDERAYDGDAGRLAHVDLDGSGALECEPRLKRLRCPELVQAGAAYTEIVDGWARATSRRQMRLEGIDTELWEKIIAKDEIRPYLEQLGADEVDTDGDGRIQRNEFVLATAFLQINGNDAFFMDADGNSAVSAAEFAGAPVAAPHRLGTDVLGRDILARLLFGLRVSLLVSLCATLVSFFLGTVLGLASGFIGGTFDRIFLRILEVAQAIPFIFVVILISVFTRDVLEVRWRDPGAQALAQSIVVLVALGAISWFSLARYARGLAISLKHADFTKALTGMGHSRRSIVAGHLLRNALPPLIAYAVLLVPVLVLEEAFLSFLGFGIQPPYPSLGILLNQGVAYMDVIPWSLVWPAAIVLALAWSLNVVGERISGRRAGLTSQGGEER